MKFITYTLALLALSTGVLYGQAPTAGLVAHWDFNGTVNDQSGNGHNGSPSNITYTFGKKNQANTAASFNGFGSYVEVPTSTDFDNFDHYTLAAVIKPQDFYKGLCQCSQIIGRGDDHTNGSWFLYFSDNYYDSSCTVTGDTSNFYFGSGAGRASLYLPSGHFITPNPVETNRWYCVVATYDSTFVKIYVDGQLVATGFSNTVTPPVGTSTGNVSIGANRSASGPTFPYWYNGLIDDIKVYNRALTPTEISNLCDEFVDTAIALAPLADTVLCGGSSLTLSYSLTHNMNPGNVFTAEMSDMNGSWANAITIGSVQSSTSGTISCMIPNGLQAATGYRIRIVATDPNLASNTTRRITMDGQLVPTVQISVGSMPIKPNSFVTFSATTAGAGLAPTYVWKQNGQVVPNATSNLWQVNSSALNNGDTITAEVTGSSAKCSNGIGYSNELVLWVLTSVEDLNGNKFVCYPNPTKGEFVFSGSVTSDDTYNINIYSVLGQKVYTGSVASQQGTVSKSINLSGIPAGTYMMHISSDKGESVMRIVVE